MSLPMTRWAGLAGALGLAFAGAGHASTPAAAQQAPLAGKAAPQADANEAPLPPGEAHVVLRCQVLSDRTVGECEVAHEAPAGHGLGEAALRMTRDIRIQPEAFKPDMVGAVVDIPLSFALDAESGDMPTGGPSTGR
jgi:hypothetical protein